jgi:hypothetical protein
MGIQMNDGGPEVILNRKANDVKFVLAIVTVFASSAVLVFLYPYLWQIVVALLAICAAFAFAVVFRSRTLIDSEQGFRTSRTTFLLLQFLLQSGFLLSLLAMVIELKTTFLFVVLWSFCFVSLILCAVVATTRLRFGLVIVGGLELMILFVIPAMSHYVSYYGGGDLFFHLSVVDHLVTSAHIPSSSYQNWPGWHVGVATLSEVAFVGPDLSLFVFVGTAISLSIPFVGLTIARISSNRSNGSLAIVLLASSPSLLLWVQYLTPTALCFGLFAVVIWSNAIPAVHARMAILITVCTSIILSHHLSALILILILIVGAVVHLLGKRQSTTYHSNELNWRPSYSLLIAIIAISYWVLVAQSFFRTFVIEMRTSIEVPGFPNISPAYDFSFEVLLFSLANIMLIFVTMAYLFLRLMRHRGIMGIGSSTSLAFSILAMIALLSFADLVIPLQVFGFVVIYRWMLFGWFFVAAIAGSVMLVAFGRISSYRRRTVRVVTYTSLIILLFLVGVSSEVQSSLDSVFLRPHNADLSPSPYLQQSDVEMSEFVSRYVAGSISVDAVMADYMQLKPPGVSVPLDDSIAGIRSGSGQWLIRESELLERGLRYTNGTSLTQVSYPGMESFFSDRRVNQLVDIGSSSFVASF